MIKSLMGWILTAGGLAGAALFVAPTLSDTPPGEALLVARPDAAILQKASFRGACVQMPAAGIKREAAWRIVGAVVANEDGSVHVTLRRLEVSDTETGKTLFLIDASGRLFNPSELVPHVPCGSHNDFPPQI